ncbi:MAG: 4Fe-4S dicluster domain-containing protein [Desulfatiglandaceae bacterium]|jgi:Fe-S-cluster-containing dehydrogenase component
MKKYNMIIDVAKCHDCNNCFLSCKDEYVDNDWLPYSLAQPWHGHRWMNIMRKERGQYPLADVAFRPTPCMHCDDAPCIKAAKNGAVTKRKDGIVIIDPEKAQGQKDLVDSCPYGAIWWNADKALPQKCTFCVHLLEGGWDKPRCVQACPTNAIEFFQVEDAEMQKMVKAEKLNVLNPELKTKSRVYYRNLYRYEKCFISGNVALQDTDECAECAKVVLRKGAKALGSVETNNYGDFKLDNLPENSGEYKVEFEYSGYKKKALAINLTKSVNLGTIFLMTS